MTVSNTSLLSNNHVNSITSKCDCEGNQKEGACNILLVTSSNFPFDGASANLLRLLTTGLAKTGRNVSVLILRGKQFGKVRLGIKRRGSIEGVFYGYCGYLSRPRNYLRKIVDNLAGMFIPLAVIIKKRIRNHIDCVMLYTSSAFECIVPLIACKLLRIPVLNHVVEWYEKEMVAPIWWKMPKWWDFLFRMKILNKYFDGLIVTSRFLKNYYIKRKVKPDKILILPNLVDISIFDTEKDLNTKKFKGIRIGYCGFPTRKDGIDDLLVAFQNVLKKNSNCELLIIGDASDGTTLLPRLKTKTNNLGIDKHVIFTGLVGWKKIPRLLNSCNILVLARPSGKFAEAGFPTKLGEYMACKKSVVVTKVGDIPRYLENSKNVMIAEPDNPKSIASKICYLVENPSKAQKIAYRGYQWAKSHLGYIEKSQEVGYFLDSFVK